jgi:hypothetical protein
MVDRSNAAKAEAQTDEAHEISAAREELGVLETLSAGVSAEIAEFSKRPQSLGKIDHTELALHEHKYQSL